MGFKDTYSFNVCFWFGYMIDVFAFQGSDTILFHCHCPIDFQGYYQIVFYADTFGWMDHIDLF